MSNTTVHKTENPMNPDVPASEREDYVLKSGPIHSFIEHTVTILFPILMVPLVYYTFKLLYRLDLTWYALLVLPVSLMAADFSSGFFHWFGDTYGSEKTPMVGQSLIKPFRLHHIDQKLMVHHTFVQTNGNTFLIGVIFLTPVLYYLSQTQTQDAFTALFSFFFCGAFFMGISTNQIHKWAHAENPNIFLRSAQKLGIILNETHHSKHHTAPFMTHYCITCGWMNPILESIGFWRKMEWFFENILGMKNTRHLKFGEEIKVIK